MPSLSKIVFLAFLALTRVHGTPQEGAPASSGPQQMINTAKDGAGAAAASAEGTLDQSRQTLPHDAIVALPQITPAGPIGTSYLTYQPRLKVKNGCVPFPAVDVKGMIGRGLKPTGAKGGSHSKCNWSPGQVYARSAPVGKWFALLFTWYFPKDETSRFPHDGTRHDWEGVVLYIKNINATDPANILAVCPSAQGKWTCATKFSLNGTFPLIQYESKDGKAHTCYLSDEIGGQQALVAWETMPGPAMEALSKYDYGDLEVPFIDAHFNATLAAAIPPAS